MCFLPEPSKVGILIPYELKEELMVFFLLYSKALKVIVLQLRSRNN